MESKVTRKTEIEGEVVYMWWGSARSPTVEVFLNLPKSIHVCIYADDAFTECKYLNIEENKNNYIFF